ncbi:MAG: hypothetical protein PF542_00670 [Nanoarchaeota archaeon]|jgi:hypothetical protein|nr:hypothetical protein [Nanoarchaeota archaeon]
MKEIEFKDKFSFSSKVEDGKRIFECRDEIGPLWGAEKMLEIANANVGEVEGLDFFEFGSAEYNIFNKIPKSGKVSHFMMLGTDLSYACFDSEIGESDFDLICEIINIHKRIMAGVFLVNDDCRLRECIDIYSKACQEKDLPVPFVYEVFAKEVPILGMYYDLNLDILKERVAESSCGSYGEISGRVLGSEKSVIFSFNVLNAPSLSFESSFWNISGAFHIHGVNEVEMLAELGLSAYFENKVDRRGLLKLGISVEEFVLKFKEKFGVLGNVQYEDGFFWWFS